MPGTLKKVSLGVKGQTGKKFFMAIFGNFFYKSKIKAIFSFFEGNFFALNNFVYDHSVLAFGQRMENGKTKWVNSMKKPLITRNRLF